MRNITLKNGVQIPILGLGTLQADKSQSQVEMILTALKMGYRHIDTAQMYLNEESVGEAIRQSGIKRSEIFVTTKQKDYFNGDKTAIRAGIIASLNRLGLDYVDLLLIHWPHHQPQYIKTTWEVFEELYQEGKLKAIGVSNFKIHHLIDIATYAKVMPMVNQVEVHPGLQQEPLRKYCASIGVYLTAYGPFMKSRIFGEHYQPELQRIGDKHQASIAQVVLAWGMKRDIIMIPKSANENRLKENLDSINVVLDDQDMLDIQNLNKGHRVYTDPDNNPSFPY